MGARFADLSRTSFPYGQWVWSGPDDLARSSPARSPSARRAILPVEVPTPGTRLRGPPAASSRGPRRLRLVRAERVGASVSRFVHVLTAAAARRKLSGNGGLWLRRRAELSWAAPSGKVRLSSHVSEERKGVTRL